MPRAIAVLFLFILPLIAQNPCPATVPSITPPGATLFTPEQEGYLGDVVTEVVGRSFPVYRQAGLTDPLNRIATRLLQYLPPNEYKFQFSIVEIPSANAVSIPGGRIFVSRRLIAFIQNEDELAGILAHEMGHVLARQASVDLSKQFRDVLKVTSVTDRADVFRKMNQLIDTPSRGRASNRREDDQVEADRISSAATWRAGYDPDALPKFFDRLTGNEGNTGNFLSDMFGATRPESRRYREMLREVQAIPASCREARVASDSDAFNTWKKLVAELSPDDLLSSLKDRDAQLQLTPKLPPDIHNIKFSPDGSLLLAQDGSGINILETSPLKAAFRIPALGARAAIFHKDGKRIVFEASSGRIEVWNLETRSRENRWEPNLIPTCQDLLVSPDGRSIACINDYGTKVRLVDLATGTEIAHHQAMGYSPLALLLTILLDERVSQGGFSPDGASFVWSNRALGTAPWAFDINQRKEISIGNPLKGALHASFSFMTTDRILAVHPNDTKKSGVFSWPDGKQVDQFTLPDSPIIAATKGGVLFVRPMRPFAVAVINIAERAVFQVSNNSAADRYNDIGAAERANGEIALYQGKSTEALTAVELPEAPLGTVRSGAHSPDLTWLALSVRGRSALWNLRSGQATLLPPFDNGFVSAEGLLGGTFEIRAQDSQGRPAGTGKMRQILDLRTGARVSATQPEEAKQGRRTLYTGRYEINMVEDPGRSGKTTVQVKDSVRNATAWLKEFESTPRLHLGNAMVVQYAANEKAADKIIKASPALKEEMEAAGKRQNVALLEVLALDTGKELGHVLVEIPGGELVIRRVHLAGRNLFVEDANNRTLGYSLDGGGRAGQQFGRVLAVDPARGYVAIENQLGSVVVFDGAMRPVADFSYPRNVIYAGFDGEGKRLLVVTGEQEIFVENLPG